MWFFIGVLIFILRLIHEKGKERWAAEEAKKLMEQSDQEAQRKQQEAANARLLKASEDLKRTQQQAEYERLLKVEAEYNKLLNAKTKPDEKPQHQDTEQPAPVRNRRAGRMSQ